MTEPTRNAEPEEATVLVVEDERGLADLYAVYLDEAHETRTAYDGEAALDEVDDDVDVILLDRRMPGMSGGEVLRELRERGYDQPVAMLTAVDPGEEILELDVDEYRVKPISQEELRGAVDALVARKHYDEELRDYLAAASKKAALEATMDDGELATSKAYAALEREVERAKEDADVALAEALETDGIAGFRDLY